MKKSLLALIIAGAVSLSATALLAQGPFVQYFAAPNQMEGPNDDDVGVEGVPAPDNSELIPGVPDNPTVGALIQLIWDVNGDGADAPSLAGTGITGDDVYVHHIWAGNGTGADGTFAAIVNVNGVLANGNMIYVRIFDRPSADGTANLPSLASYAGQTALNYPNVNTDNAGIVPINTAMGYFYVDSPTVAFDGTLPGGIFPLQFDTTAFDGRSGWTFYGTQTIPEPSTFVLAGLGILGLLVRRRMRK